MKRREFVEKIGIGTAGVVAATAFGANAAAGEQNGGHDHSTVDGPLASATVAFGQWRTEPPLDRFPDLSPRTANQHKLAPFTATIKAGGAVSFLISGTHLVLVYAPGTTFESIDGSHIVGAIPGVFPGFIDDPNNRVYRGLNPLQQPQDRVETITLAETGTYLVVCGVLPHFVDRMFAYVKVV